VADAIKSASTQVVGGRGGGAPKKVPITENRKMIDAISSTKQAEVHQRSATPFRALANQSHRARLSMCVFVFSVASGVF
jgi:hypothetical protein